ncbi:uncharacterized serine-rich protein C215.13-like [Zingiber officinale]|uniref:uncharacterized serine-rich protein C215.13-like n=1 Tax=Zingiber officinale TaxID=94328 RepID=UPI001C4D3142|nr:uncharacterized serine-rich protein C215.13-like [Zingiber officinale]
MGMPNSPPSRPIAIPNSKWIHDSLELRLEEAALHAKEQELLTALNQPSSIEVPAPPTEASNSQVVPEVSEVAVAAPAATSLPVIELTSPVSSERSLAEIAPSKRPGRKLTRAPPSKRRLTLSAEESPSEDFASAAPSPNEPTLTDLYPSLLFSSSPSSSSTAPGRASFTFPLSIPESGSLPSSFSSYLIFAPPSIPTSSCSTSSSTIPVLPVLLGGSFTTAREEIHTLFGELPPSKTIDQFSHEEIKRWMANMGLARLAHNLYSENEKLKYEAQVESLQTQFKSAIDLNTELSSKLEKQIAETNKLKSDYESTFADKLKALRLKDDEITSLNTSLNTAKTEASTKDVELKSSQSAPVVYKNGEDDRFKERVTTLINSTDFNRPIVKSILATYTAGADGAIKQLREENFLSRDLPPNFLNRCKLLVGRPADLFPLE